jgi:hypothetical protein
MGGYLFHSNFINTPMDKLEIICVESEAFYKLLEEVLRHFKNNEPKTSDKWISGVEAMKMLRIKSKATLQKMRDEGRIRFTQPEKKLLLYDSESIRDYLDDFVYEPFDLSATKNRKT